MQTLSTQKIQTVKELKEILQEIDENSLTTGPFCDSLLVTVKFDKNTGKKTLIIE